MALQFTKSAVKCYKITAAFRARDYSCYIKTRKIKRCLRNTGRGSGQQGEGLNLEAAQLIASSDCTHTLQIMGRGWREEFRVA